MEDQTPMCSPKSQCSLTSDLYNVMNKLSMAEKPRQKFWHCHHKNTQNKHNYTSLSIILYSTEPTNYNHSNCTQTLQ